MKRHGCIPIQQFTKTGSRPDLGTPELADLCCRDRRPEAAVPEGEMVYAQSGTRDLLEKCLKTTAIKFFA